jgi:GTPase SAR1 family protein
VHQLFLHDTTLALILLDPTRNTAFEDAIEWNVRLERQLRGQPAVKLLVGTKEDQIRRDLTYQPQITKLLHDCCIAGFYSTSARENTGIEALRTAIAQQINWQALSQTTRPWLFQRIREAIAQRGATLVTSCCSIPSLPTTYARWSRKNSMSKPSTPL